MDAERIFDPRFEFQSPYVRDYFGLWMVEPTEFRSLVSQVQGTDLHLHVQSAEVQQAVRESDRRSFLLSDDGIAEFHLNGPMMKSVPSMADGTSYIRFRQQLGDARRDPQVRGGLIISDTPGGAQKGNEDAAREVARFADKKPIYAFVEDMTASAGVSIASQATKRFANVPNATYGAMGTYAVVQDFSGLAENLGVKVHVIKAGDFKGLGVEGTEITDEQLQEVQRIVNIVNDSYLQLIADGLGKPVASIKALADGRAIMAADAVTAGLIDGVQSLDETKQELLGVVSGKTVVSMSAAHRSEPVEKTPATLADLKATFPDSTAEWRETQLEAEADITQAAIAYAGHVKAQADTDRAAFAKELEDQKNKQTIAGGAIGNKPLTVGSFNDDEDLLSSGDPIADFEGAVRQRLPKNRTPTYDERMDAVGLVARQNPGLHRAFINATNADGGKKIQRMIDEKYEDTPA